MKSFFKHTLRAGLLVALSCAFFPSNAFAASSYIKVNNDTENLYVTSGSKSNAASTATYSATSKILKLTNYTGGSISSNIEGLTIELVGTNTITTTSELGISNTGSITIKGDTLKLGTASILITDGNLNIGPAKSISAKSISLNDTDDDIQNKITISKDTSIDLSNSMTVLYEYNTNTKGIVLADSICINKKGSVANIKTDDGTISTFSENGTSKLNAGYRISAASCTPTPNTSNPDTIDSIYIYVAILTVSSAAFIYRRHFAKR